MPVIAASVGDALKAYKSVMGSGFSTTANDAGGLSASGGSSFGDMLKSIGENAFNSVQSGETATASAITGKGDLTSVVTAVSKAQMALQTVTAIRDEVINAYKSIIGMPI